MIFGTILVFLFHTYTIIIIFGTIFGLVVIFMLIENRIKKGGREKKSKLKNPILERKRRTIKAYFQIIGVTLFLSFLPFLMVRTLLIWGILLEIISVLLILADKIFISLYNLIRKREEKGGKEKNYPKIEEKIETSNLD